MVKNTWLLFFFLYSILELISSQDNLHASIQFQYRDVFLKLLKKVRINKLTWEYMTITVDTIY
jgi:hypothetical protein